jgi:hypothetical protein
MKKPANNAKTLNYQNEIMKLYFLFHFNKNIFLIFFCRVGIGKMKIISDFPNIYQHPWSYIEYLEAMEQR